MRIAFFDFKIECFLLLEIIFRLSALILVIYKLNRTLNLTTKLSSNFGIA